jgi:hypothetical protein
LLPDRPAPDVIADKIGNIPGYTRQPAAVGTALGLASNNVVYTSNTDSSTFSVGVLNDAITGSSTQYLLVLEHRTPGVDIATPAFPATLLTRYAPAPEGGSPIERSVTLYNIVFSSVPNLRWNYAASAKIGYQAQYTGVKPSVLQTYASGLPSGFVIEKQTAEELVAKGPSETSVFFLLFGGTVLTSVSRPAASLLLPPKP